MDGRPAGTERRGRPVGGHPRPFVLPGVAWFAGGTVLTIGLGQAWLAAGDSGTFSFLFLLAAGLPPLAALSLAARRLGPVTTWRRAAVGLLTGAVLSTSLTIVLGGIVTVLALLLLLPLRELVAGAIASGSLERLFYSPALVVALIQLAVVAPVLEELTKPVGALWLARRSRGPAEAFLIGMAGGAGFAFVENMLYEAAGARLWAHIAGLRAIGGVLHPLNAGLVALGWYRVRQGLPGAWRQWLGLYGLAVGAHALWNGGLVVLLSGIGAYFFGADTWQLNVYGIGQPGVVVTFMVLEAIVLWRVLVTVTGRLRDPALPEATAGLALHLEQPRRLAIWASGLLLLGAALGAVYGPLLSRYASRWLPLS